jgi:glycosyltransferase involved in cell wall biosynthesis
LNFSIIIPTYNSGRYIYDCLMSLESFEYDKDRYEIIVVDGGSSDKTLEIVNSFTAVKVIHSENISISNSRNLAVSKSLGRYLVFIDSDCVVDKHLLIKAEKSLKSFACYGSFYKAADHHSWIAKAWSVVERKSDGVVQWLPGGTLSTSRKIFDEVHGFDESLQTEEDEDFCRRVRLNGGVIYNDSSVASVHIGQANSIRTFWDKESWRGKSIIKPIRFYRANGFSIFDLMISGYFLLIIVTIFMIIFYPKASPVAILLLMLLPLVLSLRVTMRRKSCNMLGYIYILYAMFLLARCWSIIKFNQLKTIVS